LNLLYCRLQRLAFILILAKFTRPQLTAALSYRAN